MSRVDTAWLRMDSDAHLMLIVGVWLLQPAISLAALRQRIRQRLLRFPRFGQRVVQDAAGALWVDDAQFDIRHHVRQERLRPRPGQSQRAALQQRCGELATTPLDPDRPLWQFHLVPGYPGDKQGGCALILRVHHCIADGIALVAVMNSITDGGDAPITDGGGAPITDGGDAPPQPAARPQTQVKPDAPAADALASVLAALAPPQHGGLDLARAGLHLLGDLAALALMADDSATRLKGPLSGRKQVAWGEPLPLADVKAVSRALGCSINDVLLACVAGALAGWLRSQGDTPDGAEIRAMVPVNLRPLDQAWQLGNHFGLAPLLLPIGIANPVQRVYAVQARMAGLKGSFQPLLAYGVLALAGMLAKPVQDRLLGLFAHKTTAVMTQVPGPTQPLRLCGSTLQQSLFWVPASGGVGVGVSVLSYAGGVQLALMTDAALCPDPQAIIDRFEPEFAQLLLLSLMLPWGREGKV